MSLEDVERMLYSKSKKQRKTSSQREEKDDDTKDSSPWAQAEPIKRPFLKAGSSQTTTIEHVGKKALFILIAILCIGLGFAGYYLFQYFSGYDISVTLSVPREVEVGDPFLATLLIDNKSDRDLFDAQAFFTLPGGIISIEHPNKKVVTFPKEDFLKGSLIKKEIELVAQGEPYSTIELGGGISYQYGESVFSNAFERRETTSIALKDSVIGLDVTLPESVIEGEEFEIHAEYYNRGNEQIPNIEVEYVLPRSFTLQGSDPVLTSGTQFITTLNGSQEEAAVASGFLSEVGGTDVEIGIRVWRRMGAARVLVAQKNQFVTIAQSPLQVFIEAEPDETVALSPGARIRYSAIVSNTSREDVYDVVLQAVLQSDVFNLGAYDGEGYVDDAQRTITWRGSDVSWLRHLSPGSSQTLAFDLILQNTFEEQYTNKTADVEVVVTSPTVPFGVIGRQIEGRDTIQHSIGGALALKANTYALSPHTDIQNSGPIPPQVGKETTYVVVLEPHTQGTAFQGVSVQADLSAGVVWTGKVVVEGTQRAPSYNPQTKRITWSSERLSIGETPRIMFQIALTPSQSMAGGAVDLIKNIEIRGIDSFTQQTKRETLKPITTRTISDAGEFQLDYYKVLP